MSYAIDCSSNEFAPPAWFEKRSDVAAASFSAYLSTQLILHSADEVDALLGKRREEEHEISGNMKTEFMQLWDGFLTDSKAKVMILAATNRPHALDDAILRRCLSLSDLPLMSACSSSD